MLTLDEVQAARLKIAPYVRHTPTERSDTLSRRLGTNLYLKLELFQKTGAFKPRGAFNKMLSLSEEERERGVVAFSGGNFAQAVAYAGSVLGVRTRILMPASTPQNYLDATREYGAEVELVPTLQAMIDGARAYTEEGMTFMHPFDDPLMMAGNGTLGLELLADIPNLTDVIVSIGGGGLMAGLVTVIKTLKPDVRIWGVETEGADTMARSLEAGEVVQIQPTSISKTLGAPYVAEAALRLAQEHLEGVTVVPDREAVASLKLLLERTKVLTEPAASCTLAAAERLKENFGKEHHVALVLCGGNVSLRDVCTFEAQFHA